MGRTVHNVWHDNEIGAAYNFFTKHVFVGEYQTIFTYQSNNEQFNNNGWKNLMRDLFYLFDSKANDYSSVTEYSDLREKIKNIAKENTAQGITYKQLHSFLSIIFHHIHSTLKSPLTNSFNDLNVSTNGEYNNSTTVYNDHGSQIKKYADKTDDMLSTLTKFVPSFYWGLDKELNEENTKKMIDNTNILLSLLINHKNFWFTKGSSQYDNDNKGVTINKAFNLFIKNSKNIKRDYYRLPKSETAEQRLLSKWDGKDYIRGDKKKDLYATTIYADSETEKQEFIGALEGGKKSVLNVQLKKMTAYLKNLNESNIFTVYPGQLEKLVKIRGGKRRKTKRKSLKKRRKTKRKSLKKRKN